jgi:hypothetical protein
LCARCARVRFEGRIALSGHQHWDKGELDVELLLCTLGSARETCEPLSEEILPNVEESVASIKPSESVWREDAAAGLPTGRGCGQDTVKGALPTRCKRRVRAVVTLQAGLRPVAASASTVSLTQ